MMLIICLLSACGTEAADLGIAAVADSVSTAVGIDGMIDIDESYVINMMKLESTAYTEYIAKRVNVGTSIDEYGIFKGADSDQTAELKTAVEAYLQLRLDTWMSEYLPEEFPKLQSSEVWTQGNYVMYVILGDGAKTAARTAFSDAFEA